MKKNELDMAAWQEKQERKERRKEKRRARRLAFIAKWDPIRFRYLRIFRNLIFYLLFIASVKASASSVSVDDPDFMVICGASSLAMLISYIFLAGVFVLYDPTARRRFCHEPPKETGIFSEWKFSLLSYEFLSKIAVLTVLPSFLGTKYFLYPLCTFFGKSNFSHWEIYGLYLLTVLPIMAVIDLFMRVRTRRYWRTLDEEEAIGKRFDIVSVVWLCILIIFGLGFIAGFYFAAIILLIEILLIPGVLLSVLGIVLLIFLLRYIRAFRIRSSFLRRLKKVCREEGAELSPIARPYRSLFERRNTGYHFTVKLEGQVYACKMIGSVFKNAPMVFCDAETGYFHFGIQFRKHRFVLYRDWFTHRMEAPNADRKILIVTPAPRFMKAIQMYTVFSSENTAFVTEGKHERPLDNASAIYDATVFSGGGFINAVKRKCLDKREEN